MEPDGPAEVGASVRNTETALKQCLLFINGNRVFVLNTDLDDGDRDRQSQAEGGELIIRLTPSFLRFLYYFCAFADLGHTGIKSIC